MRGIFSLLGLVIVLAIIGINVRNEMRANKALLPHAATASDAASAPFGGTSSPSVAQFQAELNKAVQDSAAHSANRAEAAESDATRSNAAAAPARSPSCTCRKNPF